MADLPISSDPTATTPLTGAELVPIVQSGVNKQTTVGDLRYNDVTKVVGSAVSSTSTTPASVTSLEAPLTPGTWLVKLWMVLQSTSTSTGMSIHLNCSGGTVTTCVATWYTLTTGTSATSGVLDQASSAAVFQTMEGRAQRANNVSGQAFGGVDTANADQFAVLEGVVVVTATTTLQTMLASEVASSGVSVRPGTTLVASKVA